LNYYWIYHYLDRYIGIPFSLALSLFDRLHPRKRTSGSGRILVIKLAMLGDTILLEPVLRALRNKYPGSRISMLCSPVNEEIVKNWDFMDEYIVFDAAACLKYPWKFAGLLLGLRKKNFDISLDFETWPRIIPIMTYLAGVRTRLGFKVDGQHRHYLYTRPVEHAKGKHELKCFIDLANAAGVEVDEISFSIKIGKNEERKIENTLKENGIGGSFIIIHPGCGKNGYLRQWLPERYALVADHVIEKYGLGIVLTGGKYDETAARQVSAGMKNKPLDLSGNTTLGELAALVKKASAVICGNTGIVHISAALGTPVIALHGPTDPDKWGPWGPGHTIIRKDMPCRPCLYLGFEYGCKKRTCMDSITVEEVKEAVDRKITEKS
jgi:lipopolysaccharide heptosyltransferase II